MPAEEVRFLPFCKVAEDDERLVTGPVLRPEIRDRQKTIIGEKVIRSVAHNYLERLNLPKDTGGSSPGLMHTDFSKSLKVVESWVTGHELEYEISAETAEVLRSSCEGMEIRARKSGDEEIQFAVMPVGTWMLTMKVYDDTVWEGVKNGTYKGFSVGGTAHVVYEDAA